MANFAGRWGSAEHREYRRQRRAMETPEQREKRLQQQRARRERNRITELIGNARRRGVTLDRREVEILVCDPCAYCGVTRVGVDHIVPTTAGGGDDWSNLTAACGSCNNHKTDKSLLTFLLWRHDG